MIGVGNLTTGGTGKTPHIEYLVKLLSGYENIAVLSRGYGRKTKGFLYVSETSDAEQSGDEPLQIKVKFPQLTVAVCESRKDGIERILKDNSLISLILLDDAFQHRFVRQSLSVLLVDYNKVFQNDYLLPAGNLREPFSSAKRADVIIISKSHEVVSDEIHYQLRKKFASNDKQTLFFSSISYDKVQHVFSGSEISLTKDISCFLVTGIADASLMKKYLEDRTELIKHLEYNDHHIFTNDEIQNIVKIFSTIAATNKIIVTTEKDAMRLKQAKELKNLPVYYLPIEIGFHNGEEFNRLIKDHVRKN